MSNVEDQFGKRFGRLTVVSRCYEHGTKSRERFWNCRCDCGGTTIVRTASLTSGNTKSCGCLQKERTSEANTTHGKSTSAEYNIWAGMIARCTNPTDDAYSRYGGRGISVCESWLASFEAFYADMGPRPGPEYSIERSDNNQGYSVQNCVWATAREQANNRRNNFRTDRGQTLADAVKDSAIDYKIIHQRMTRDNMSLETATTTPLRQAKKYKHGDESKTLQEWSRHFGISITTLEHRLSQGWDFSIAVTTPVRTPRTYTVSGKEYSISELSSAFNVPEWKLRQRIVRDGWTVERAVFEK